MDETTENYWIKSYQVSDTLKTAHNKIQWVVFTELLIKYLLTSANFDSGVPLEM